jgi:hypothetical protein
MSVDQMLLGGLAGTILFLLVMWLLLRNLGPSRATPAGGGPGTIPAPTGRSAWMVGFVWALVVGLVAAVIVAAWYFFADILDGLRLLGLRVPAVDTIEKPRATIALFIIGAVAVVVLIYAMRKVPWSSAPSVDHKFLVPFALLVAVCFIAWSIHPIYALTMLQVSGGIIGALVILLVIAALFWKGGLWAGAITVLVAWVVLSNLRPICPTGDTVCVLRVQEEARIEAERRRVIAEEAAREQRARQSIQLELADRHCDGSSKQYTFSPKWEKFNPNGQCSVDLYYLEQDVKLWVKITLSGEIKGPIRRGEVLPDGAEWIMSEGKTFPAQVTLVPDRRKKLRSVGGPSIWGAMFGN